jgi:hypothetical protein
MDPRREGWNQGKGVAHEVERRGWVIAFEIGSTGNGRNPIFNGRRQPSCGGTSRMTRECQVRICERLGVKFPGPTLHFRRISQ